MKSSAVVAFLFLANFSALAAPTPDISNLLDCSVSGWSLKRLNKSAFQMIPTAENCSGRFTINSNQPKISDGWRSELTDPLLVPLQSEMTYEFETYVPSTSARHDLSGMVVAQWHDIKGYQGAREQRPPVSVRIRGDELTVELWNTEHLLKDAKAEGIPLFSLKNPFDQWIKIEMHAKWSDSDKGFIDIKVNGARASYHGPIGYGDDYKAPYFKFGVYTVHPFQGDLTVFHRGYFRKVLFNPEE